MTSYKQTLSNNNEMDGTFKTLAAAHLLNLNDEAKKITDEKVQLFHLYLCRQT